MTPQNPGKDARHEQNFGDQPEKKPERNQAEQARPNQHEQTPRGQYQSGQGRYGLRFENMSAEELEYYRPFWEEKPDPDAVPPELIDHLKVRARRRLVNALSLIAVAVGVTLTLSGMLSSALYLSFPGALAAPARGKRAQTRRTKPLVDTAARAGGGGNRIHSGVFLGGTDDLRACGRYAQAQSHRHVGRDRHDPADFRGAHLRHDGARRIHAAG